MANYFLTIGGTTTINFNTVSATKMYGGTTVERSISKEPIIIPIPRNNAMAFDIGFVPTDTITINSIWVDTERTQAATFARAIRFWDPATSYIFRMGSWGTMNVKVRNFSVTEEAGKGDIMNTRTVLEVVQ